MKHVHEFATREALMGAVAARIAKALNQAILKHGNACAALSGGGTPEPAYRALAELPVNWRKVTFALVDERFVDPSSEASNEGMLRRALAPALRAGADLLPMFAPDTTVEDAAQRAEHAYAGKRIDIAVMGMGEDGHTASWFPNTAQLDDALNITNPRTVIAVHAPAAAGSADRLTLTHSAVQRAGDILLLLTGDAKRARFNAALATGDAPVAKLFQSLRATPEIWWAP